MAGGPAYLRSGGSSNKIFNTGDLGINGIKAGPWFLRFGALIFAYMLSSFALFYALMNYLTNVWNLSTTQAAGIINIFDGISDALGIVFAFFTDAFLGDFYMLVLSSIAYCIGLGLLSLSTPAFFGPCSEYKEECIGHIQKVLFFASLSFMAVGRATFEVTFDTFLDQQSEAAEVPAPAEATEVPAPAEAAEAPAPAEATEASAPAEAPAPSEAAEATEAPAPSEVAEAPTPVEAEDNGISALLIFMLGIIGGCIALPYIKPWSILFGIPAICFLAATVLFLTGYQLYKYSKPEGSPLTIGLRVFVAAATKDFQQVKGFTRIYEDDDTKSTSSLRWLDKAAIKFPDQRMLKSWTLCSVREVEDTKTGIRMVPVLLTLIGTGLVLSIGNTYFVEQANHMDLQLGSIKIHIQIFLLFYLISFGISPLTYALLKKCISIPKRYYVPNKIALGMVFSILCCITAALVETRRLDNERIPMSVFVLLPQFLLLGAAEGLTESGIESFLRNQVPESMHKYLLHFKSFVFGLGRMANVLWVYVVGKVSERNNNPNWFQHTSNESRLDLYYWTLAGLSAVNLVIYAIVASTYKYDDDIDDA